MRIAVQMDEITSIQIAGDTTFALLLEAQERGLEIFYYTPETLCLDEGRLFATGRAIEVRDVPNDHVTLGQPATVDLATVDCVLLRQDPPFDMAYITTTHLLERLAGKTLVVNDPFHVRNAPEKLSILEFADLMPPTMIAREAKDIAAFHARHGDVIVKPLYGNGGAGIFRITDNKLNLNALIEMFQSMSREPLMIQQYRPEVQEGDKRILLIDGEVAGAINRLPQDGETRSNMHVGGKAVATDLTERDREICGRLGPFLRERGLLLTGIDVIGPYLTEINVTSPTGVRELECFTGINAASLFWAAVLNRLERN